MRPAVPGTAWRTAPRGDERDSVVEAFHRYLDTIPETQRFRGIAYDVKDITANTGFGIGSAGLPAYTILIEGFNQALDNDVVLSMKQGNVAAPSRVVDDEEVHGYFLHHGHRTAVSQRALQAHADPLLGYTDIDGVGFVVSEISPYEADLDWTELTEPDELTEVVSQLGQAVAKVHCVSDSDSDQSLVGFQTEEAIVAAIGDDEDDFVADIVAFGLSTPRSPAKTTGTSSRPSARPHPRGDGDLIFSRCCGSNDSAAVAERGGQPAHREQDAALHQFVVVAGPVAAQQLDLQVVQRLEVREPVEHRPGQRGLSASRSSCPVISLCIRMVRSCSSAILSKTRRRSSSSGTSSA